MSLLVNKKATFEYTIVKEYMAGVVLTGPEVKSLRNKSGSLSGSFVKVLGGQVYLLNAQITPYQFADNRDYDPKRTRKLLLKKKEIEELADNANTKGYTLVPLSFELVRNTIKLKFGLGKGKKIYEKRAQLRQRDITRDISRELKDKVRLR